MGSANPPFPISATVVTVTASYQFLNAFEGPLSIRVDNSVQICLVVATSVMRDVSICLPEEGRKKLKYEQIIFLMLA